MSDEKRAPLTYKDAGVDIDAGEEVVGRIRSMISSTMRPEVISELGGFAGLCGLPKGISDPVLVSATDGVGTKLKIAFATGRHDTVGIDLVAMVVNDIVTTGAQPLFFLDYLATGKLEPDVAESVVSGIVAGCRDAGCALLGGETAELPGFYAPGEYDLAGFAVGVVERGAVITGRDIVAGDRVLGLASSGVHSNGYSLVRKALLESQGLELDAVPPELGVALGDELLRPTRIYVRAVRAMAARSSLKGIAHITGGGLIENPPRIVPAGLGLVLDQDRWDRPPIFGMIQDAGVPQTEMWRIFNMGIGLVVITAPDQVAGALAAVQEEGERGWEIGEVVVLEDDAEARVTFR